MGIEIDLLKNYPKSKRDTKERVKTKTIADIKIARKFGKDFFDGERKYGYGGYVYNPKYWFNTTKDIINFYKLNNKSSLLDIGCAKGFMLFELKKHLPGLKIRGLDISKYAIDNAHPDVKKYLDVGNAIKLPYENNSFDCIISITTLHNLHIKDCDQALKEIQRVTKKNSFITVDAYSNENEKKLMEAWNLTALTVMHTDDWKIFFNKAGYTGDYFWFKP